MLRPCFEPLVWTYNDENGGNEPDLGQLDQACQEQGCDPYCTPGPSQTCVKYSEWTGSALSYTSQVLSWITDYESLIRDVSSFVVKCHWTGVEGVVAARLTGASELAARNIVSVTSSCRLCVTHHQPCHHQLQSSCYLSLFLLLSTSPSRCTNVCIKIRYSTI